MPTRHYDAVQIRPGARVLLIDSDGRVLLFASGDAEGRTFWYPPGGGSEPGEGAEETAKRELLEETGLCDIELTVEIGWRRGLASWGGVTYDCRERWFLARVAPCQIDITRFTDEERRSITTHRWWAIDELASTTDRLIPRNLAVLVSTILCDGPPAAPLDLGE